MTGPLTGLQVVELAGIGPAPHAAMLLADHGADVTVIVRPAPVGSVPEDLMSRGKRRHPADLKAAADRDAVLALIASADVVIEGMRPGTAERLGLGPAACRARNPRLIYARLTGWGQDGPLAPRAGHDINYLALTGVLAMIGRAGERPVVPVNLVGDFGGGSLYLVVGILAALWERERSGVGQVVDSAIVDGVGSLAHMLWELAGRGTWRPERGTNLLDGGAPFYDTYTCADGRQVAVGALEPAFYAQLLAGLGLAGAGLPPQRAESTWPQLRTAFTAAFLRRSRDEWTVVFAGTDACVTPVLTIAEAATHPHLGHRQAFRTVDGASVPAPAPRFHPLPAPT